MVGADKLGVTSFVAQKTELIVFNREEQFIFATVVYDCQGLW